MQRDPFDIHAKAKRRLPGMMFDFIEGGTGGDLASMNNEQALERVKLQPRALVNIEDVDMTTEFLGQTYDVPFGVAPMGMCNLITPNADEMLSREAAKRKFPHCVSTASSTTMEDTMQQADGMAWFQLYAGTNGELTFEMVDRALAAGYQNLLYTIDTPHHSRRTRDLKNGFAVPLKIGLKQFVDFALHPAWSISTALAGVPKTMNYETSKVQKEFDRNDSRGGVDWDFLDTLRKRWPNKLILKGVMSADDAVRAQSAGCDAVYVSNHGGRQLDSAPAAIDALPLVRAAVGPDYPLVFDSGVRCADDIVRAIALGANFVLLGRPVMYALGAQHLSTFLDLLTFDLESVIAQTGSTEITQLTTDILAPSQGNAHD